MKNPFAWCFGRGKKGRRKAKEQLRQEAVPDEAPRMRYPLYDPRTVTKQLTGLPSEHSSSPSVPQELDANEQITLPKDEEEEELPVAEVKEEEKEPRKPTAPPPSPPPQTPTPPSPSPPPPSPSPPPPSPSPPPPSPSPPRATPPRQASERKPADAASPLVTRPESESAKVTSREATPSQERPRSGSSPSGPSASPEPPTPTQAVAPPSTAPAAETSVSLPRQTEPPSPAAAAAPLPLSPPPAAKTDLDKCTHMRGEAAMSPLEKLASARLGTHPGEPLEDAEAATAPCTPPAWDEGGVTAETEMQRLERTRRLQQKLLALEESVDAKELHLIHDSSRRRRKFRQKFPRYRVSWRCVQTAIDFYADVQDGPLEDLRMCLDSHPPKDCRICKHIDYRDVPVLP